MQDTVARLVQNAHANDRCGHRTAGGARLDFQGEMTRATVRTLKRAMRGSPEGSQDRALALLERSIGFGHRRLAVLRLCAAVQVGARVKPEHWLYCACVAEKDHDGKLRQAYRAAVADASGGG